MQKEDLQLLQDGDTILYQSPVVTRHDPFQPGVKVAFALGTNFDESGVLIKSNRLNQIIEVSLKKVIAAFRVEKQGLKLLYLDPSFPKVGEQ